MSRDLSGIRVAILATDGVERVELEQPRGALYGAGTETEQLSIHSGEIQARQFDLVSAGTFEVDKLVTCGHCRNCEEGLTNYCRHANKLGIARAAYGFADMGPWQGGQPFAPAPGVMGRMGETCPADSAKAMSAVVAELQRDGKRVEFIV